MNFTRWMLILVAIAFLSGPLTALAQETELEPDPMKDHGRRLTEDEAAALALVDEIAKEVEEIRGLKFKEEFSRKIITPQEIRELVIRMSEEEMPEELMAAITRLWSRIGFFPPDMDILECQLQFLEAGALGLYDNTTKTLYLLEGFSPDGAKPVIFHELVHALEDQHIGLDVLQEKSLESSDEGSAVQALVEGSACFFMNIYLKRHPELVAAMTADAMKKAAGQLQMLLRVPSVLFASGWLFPYVRAPKWVKAVCQGDPAAVTALYENLPVSTEQILHPAKYGPEGDYPYQIGLPDLEDVLPEGWRRGHEDVLGELYVALLMNELDGGPPLAKIIRISGMTGNSLHLAGNTRIASEGWDGDRVVSYEGPDGRTALVWASRWDTPKDAEEFATAYRTAYDQAKKPKLPADQQALTVLQKEDRVLVIEGFPPELNEGIALKVVERTTFQPDPRDKVDSGE
jgi:hypothetical protein